MDSRNVTNDADLIDALGGAEKVAAELTKRLGEDITRFRVAMWKSRNIIPPNWKPMMASIATDKGVSVPKGFLRPKVSGRRDAVAAEQLRGEDNDSAQTL